MTPNTTDVMLEYARLRAALGWLRMRYANLLAAARATLTAARDGDANPLAYLIDELAAQGQLPPAETGSLLLDADELAAWLRVGFASASHSADGGNQR
jgi:hypothetical protein